MEADIGAVEVEETGESGKIRLEGDMELARKLAEAWPLLATNLCCLVPLTGMIGYAGGLAANGKEDGRIEGGILVGWGGAFAVLGVAVASAAWWVVVK